MSTLVIVKNPFNENENRKLEERIREIHIGTGYQFNEINEPSFSGYEIYWKDWYGARHGNSSVSRSSALRIYVENLVFGEEDRLIELDDEDDTNRIRYIDIYDDFEKEEVFEGRYRFPHDEYNYICVTSGSFSVNLGNKETGAISTCYMTSGELEDLEYLLTTTKLDEDMETCGVVGELLETVKGDETLEQDLIKTIQKIKKRGL